MDLICFPQPAFVSIPSRLLAPLALTRSEGTKECRKSPRQSHMASVSSRKLMASLAPIILILSPGTKTASHSKAALAGLSAAGLGRINALKRDSEASR